MRGQLFVQDISVSLVIAIIAILSLIAFINFHNNGFLHDVRNEHKMAVLERISNKLFLENGYVFYKDSFAVSRSFIGFVNNLQDEERYEQFREEMALSREGVSYDVMLSVLCDDGTSAEGGRNNGESVETTVLVNMEGVICNVNINIGER